MLALGIDAVMGGASGMPGGMGGGMRGNHGNGGMGGMVGGIGGSVTTGRQPTRCLQLSNMVTQEDLATDDAYEELKEDVTGEMEKYAVAASGAAVVKIEIPKGTIGSTEVVKAEDGSVVNNSGVGNIYVEFSTLEASVKAFMDLPTRKFGESYIKAAYYPEATMSTNV